VQTLLLELGAPLVFAFILLAIAKFIRALINRNNPQSENEFSENHAELTEEEPPEEENEPHST
jgi:hypothetical protein